MREVTLAEGQDSALLVRDPNGNPIALFVLELPFLVREHSIAVDEVTGRAKFAEALAKQEIEPPQISDIQIK